MKITWFGNASILIEPDLSRGDPDKRLLFDPFVELKGGENPGHTRDFIRETNVCVTHGHLDHLLFVSAMPDATVFCTKTPAATLQRRKADPGNIVLVKPGSQFHAGAMTVRVLPGKHTDFDGRLIRSTLPRLFLHLPRALSIGRLHCQFPENGETVVYEIFCEGRRILLLGSMALDENYSYPTGADLLILPFQGQSDPGAAALRIVERLRPRRILLDHFDDAFPPISCRVDTRAFKRRMDSSFPFIKVVKPAVGKPVSF